MAIKKSKVLTALRADLTNAIPYHDEWKEKRAKWVKEYNGEPYGNEVEGKAKVVSRDIKNAAENQHASIIDPFVSDPDMISCAPVTFEDRPAAKQATILLNYQFCRRFKRYNFIADSFKVFQREGTVIGKVSWIYREKETTVQEPILELQPVMGQAGIEYQQVVTGYKSVKKMVKAENRPDVELCNNNFVYIDAAAENDIDNAQFLIYEYKSNYSKLSQQGIYEDLDKIDVENSNPPVDEATITYNSKDTNASVGIADKPRKELTVYEYWGNYDLNGDGIAEPIVCVWVNDTIIRLEPNPYPNGEIPFVVAAFNKDPFSIRGIAHAENIGTDQKIKTGIKRAILDTLDASTNGQKGTKVQTMDPLNLRKFQAGEDFEFKGEAKDIWVGKFAEISPSILNFYGLVSNEIDTQTGVTKNNKGPGASALGSPQNDMLDAIGHKEVDISRNYAENFLVPILRKWHAMNGMFLDEEEVVRLTNDEFVEIKRDDLLGEIDIQINIATATVNLQKSKDLAFIYQTTAQTMDNGMRTILMAEIARLGKMPDLAKRLEEYQPQQDPLMVEKQQLEIEKLKAEIAERSSRAQENGVDMRLKSANASLAEAKARSTHSAADVTDLNFLKEQDGSKRMEDLENKTIEHGSRLSLAQMQNKSV